MFYYTALQTKSDKNCGFSWLDQQTPSQVAKRLVELLPVLCDHLEGTSGFFQVGSSSFHQRFKIVAG